MTDWQSLQAFDRDHIWHPYAPMPNPQSPLAVQSTQGSRITLADGRTLIDGMSSWWAAIHGYNHSDIVAAMHHQIEVMPHIMFGGLTHQPAIDLAQKLVSLTPEGLEKVFFVDSGSVAMEVAIKMALQYQISRGKPSKSRLLSIKGGYHGDTIATMALCDPDNGMHTTFGPLLPQHFFAPRPNPGMINTDDSDIEALEAILATHHDEIAALTLEPIIQGAGGMRPYRPSYLKQARALCDHYNVLLIADEIATGFGRTGELFGCNWAGITPDIMALGKTLTGGHITLAATLATETVSRTISQGDPGLLMHGPTYMGNPLACATASANIDVLLNSPWQANIARIEHHFQSQLTPLKSHEGVKDVRILGAIAAVELDAGHLGPRIQDLAVEQGVWLRPFGALIYTMPAYNMPDPSLSQLTDGMVAAITQALDEAQS
ncbi:adenosylmethionine--8-amino-7-oxononanoate transaminase [Thiomicrospira sp. WB1]|uniref:adenosylmethionine--8-amino-7-oxononanoate transaminase n=1 Tax=Thiomicrospira sp. WB1 TaxID=1685380 RepID=UPI0007484AF8|nr:adenosylmethionine--8-amino-7-oxononanoate transaminase [Thiomicrospira sp. WB1]KUJ71149.1 adenosylmethionine-8-amino-7-oxononanoate aminotransferase [Thiomicrospira sp. WB1]